MRRIAWLVTAVVVVLGVTGLTVLHAFGGSGQPAEASTAQPAGAGNAQSGGAGAAGARAGGGAGTGGGAGATASAQSATTTKSYSLPVAGLKRSYEVIAPVKALPKSAPVIVMLSGFGASVAQEISRDQLVPYAATGKAEVVYPVAEGDSWNADGCCGFAYTHKVNDLAFLKALVAKVDRGHARPVDVIGYSNGARLAYRVVCTDPALFNAYAMVKGVPTPGCAVRQPVTLIQVASVNDPEIPYKPGDHGLEPLPVTTLMGRMHSADKCPAKSAVTHTQGLTLTAWAGCGDGTRLDFAVWQAGVHSYPRPPVSQPAATPVIWSFFTRTALAPRP